MSVRPLRPWLYRTIFFTLACPVFVLAQGTPLTLGPLAVNVPPGWNAQTSAVPVRIFSPESTPQQFFAVEFFPPEQTTQELREHHSLIWARVAAAVGPASPPQSGVLGRFVWTRAEVARPFGRKETLVLYSTKAGQLYIAVAVDGTHASLVARNLPVVEAMLSNAILSDAASVPAPASSGPSDSVGNQAYAANPSSLGEYVYATPPEWTANQYPDGIVLTSPASATGERCLISLWPMRPAGASLQNDANNIFAEVFRTYEP
ncbi:MAG TPA: hypothetical protein VEW69_04765, partial [Alphaproteobacteria bacterium]|nr:hypothetical protein [Alphaproteobacteria bacterium]